MWVSTDGYNAQKAQDFEDETPDPFQPARDALQFARDTAAPWQPAQWANDAADFARSTAPGMGDVQRSGQVEQQAEPAPTQAAPDDVGGLLGNAGQSIGNAAGAAGQAIGSGLQTARNAIPTTVELGVNPQAAPSTGNEGNLLQRIGAIATQYGLDPNVAKAIAITEDGLSGRVGDSGQSFGPFQFYKGGGQLLDFAKTLGVDPDTAGKIAQANPEFAVDWALKPGGYLGDAIRRGVERGLSGAELATYAQHPGKYQDLGDPGGQRSVSPERAGQNYARAAGTGDARGAGQPGQGQAPYSFPVAGYSGKDVPLHWGSNSGGTDLFAAEGTPVVAMRGGRVISSSSDSIGGNAVLIQGDDGNQYYYAHLYQAPAVKAGQAVAAGDYLGGVGDTGNAKGTGAHLHFGMGPSIVNGAGPQGGTGAGFDAVGLLRNVLAGGVPAIGDALGNAGRAVGNAWDQATTARPAPDMSGVTEPGQRPNPGVDAGRDPGFAWKAAQPGMGDVQRASATGEASGVGDFLGRAGETVGGAMGRAGEALGDLGLATGAVTGDIASRGIQALRPGEDVRALMPDRPTMDKLRSIEAEQEKYKNQYGQYLLDEMGIDPSRIPAMVEESARQRYGAQLADLRSRTETDPETAGPIRGLYPQNIAKGAPYPGEITDYPSAIRAGEEFARDNPQAELASEIAFPFQYGTAYKVAAKAGMLPAKAALGLVNAPGNMGAVATVARVKQMYEKPPGAGLPDISAITDRITKELFNQNVGASHVQEIVERQLGTNKLPDALNLEAHMAVNPGMITHLRVQETLQPALQQVGAEGLPGLKALLTFQDNIDKAAAVGKRVEADLLAKNIDPVKASAAGAKAAANRRFSSGVNATESQAAIAEMQNQLGPGFATVKDSADKAVAFGKATRDRLLSSGMIDQATRDYFELTFPNYVPIRILDYLEPQSGRVSTGKAFSVRDTGIHRLSVEGTERYTVDPISALMEQAGKVEALATRNDSFNTLINLRNTSPELQALMPAKPMGFNPTKDDLVVTGLINGKRETFAATDYLKEALDNESYGTIPFVGPVMGLYRSLITSKSPSFLARNASLDAFSYALRSTIREGGPWPKNIANVITELGRGYADAFQGIGSQTYHGNTAAMLKAGGGQFGWRQRTPAQLAASAEELTHDKAWEVNNTADALRVIKKVLQLKPVEATGERIELAPRAASFSLATKRGATPLQAMADARSVTIDFSQGGKLAKLVNQVVPFFNVTLQATAQINRAYHEDPKAALATGMTFLAAPAAAFYAWNNSTDAMKRDYEDVPDYEKEQGMVMLIPGMSYDDAQGNRHPQYILFRTREFTPAVMIAQDAVARATGGKPQEMQELLSAMWKNVSPIQGGNVTDTLGSTVLPGISTAMQISQNKNWYQNSTIETERNDQGASALSKGIAGAIDTRPSRVEFGIKDTMGGVGATVLSASNLVTGTPPTKAGPSEIPVVGGVVSSLLKGATGQRLQEAQDAILAPEDRAFLRKSGIKWEPSITGWAIGKVQLTKDEQELYQTTVNAQAGKMLAPLKTSDAWKQSAPEVKEAYVRDQVEKIRASVRDYIEFVGGEKFSYRKYLAETGQVGANNP